MAGTPASSSSSAVSILDIPAEVLVQVGLAGSINADGLQDAINLKRSCRMLYNVFTSESVISKAAKHIKEALLDRDPGLEDALEFPCYGCLQVRSAKFFEPAPALYLPSLPEYDHYMTPWSNDDTYLTGCEYQSMRAFAKKISVAVTDRRCAFCKLRGHPRNRHHKQYFGLYHVKPNNFNTNRAILNWFGRCEGCQDIGWWVLNGSPTRDGDGPSKTDCCKCGERERRLLNQELTSLAANIRQQRAKLTQLETDKTGYAASSWVDEFQAVQRALKEACELRAQKLCRWQEVFHISEGRAPKWREMQSSYEASHLLRASRQELSFKD